MEWQWVWCQNGKWQSLCTRGHVGSPLASSTTTLYTHAGRLCKVPGSPCAKRASCHYCVARPPGTQPCTHTRGARTRTTPRTRHMHSVVELPLHRSTTTAACECKNGEKEEDPPKKLCILAQCEQPACARTCTRPACAGRAHTNTGCALFIELLDVVSGQALLAARAGRTRPRPCSVLTMSRPWPRSSPHYGRGRAVGHTTAVLW